MNLGNIIRQQAGLPTPTPTTQPAATPAPVRSEGADSDPEVTFQSIIRNAIFGRAAQQQDNFAVTPFTIPESAARGIRNNNPGNIDRTKTTWQGQSKDQSGDSRFVVFDSPQHGIRALYRTLNTYQSKHGLNTVKDIINRWAPPSENKTSAYVNSVARALGVAPSDKINVRDPDLGFKLVRAIIKHENGDDPYSDDIVREGIALESR